MELDNMEKRKFPRAKINVTIKIESLYKERPDILDNIDEFIEVRDISKTGVRFFCTHDLPLGYHFNAKIVIDNERHFFCVLKIIRKEESGTGYDFGCEFVGLANVLSGFIDDLV